MSHFTTIKTKFTDLEALKKHSPSLVIPILQEKLRCRVLGDKQELLTLLLIPVVDMELALSKKVPLIAADWWGVGINQEEFVAKITQRYAYHKVLSEAKRQNWTKVKEERMPDGTIKLVLTKY